MRVFSRLVKRVHAGGMLFPLALAAVPIFAGSIVLLQFPKDKSYVDLHTQKNCVDLPPATSLLSRDLSKMGHSPLEYCHALRISCFFPSCSLRAPDPAQPVTGRSEMRSSPDAVAADRWMGDGAGEGEGQHLHEP
jgi:hypothetical protein